MVPVRPEDALHHVPTAVRVEGHLGGVRVARREGRSPSGVAHFELQQGEHVGDVERRKLLQPAMQP